MNSKQVKVCYSDPLKIKLYQYPVVLDSIPNLDKAEATNASGMGAIKLARLEVRKHFLFY